MITPVTYKNTKPHLFWAEKLIVSKGNEIGSLPIDGDFNTFEKIGYFKSTFSKSILSSCDIFRRALRLGFHDLKTFNQGFIGVQNGSIVWLSSSSGEFVKVFEGFRGSRPLGVFIHPNNNKVYFGEYFGNKEREEVYIYVSDNAVDWEVAWTFEVNSIRHVHGLIWDEFRKGIWVLTGDSDSESGLWFTSDDFKTLEKVSSGTQKARAVEVIPIVDGLIVPMDSPLEQNYVNIFDLNTKTYTSVAALPGSAFHATLSNDIYLISTVTEPSDVNIVNYASVWASLDGRHWKELSRFKKDWIPVKYQFIGRYSEIFFPHGDNNSDFIFAYGQAIKDKSNSMLVWSKQEVVNYLTQ